MPRKIARPFANSLTAGLCTAALCAACGGGGGSSGSRAPGSPTLSAGLSGDGKGTLYAISGNAVVKITLP